MNAAGRGVLKHDGCSMSISFGIALLASLLWLIPRLTILQRTGPPDPWIVDELSYLLLADTFAHGRLTNPPPPMSRFFESAEIVVTPSYSSKYPPAQGLWLAFGEKTFGSPFAGVILQGLVMVFSMALMFSAWVSWRWAAVFSGLVALRFQWPFYWVNSYWGGCAFAVAAALLLFAAGRFRKAPGVLACITSGAVFGCAVVMLFLTRPYEGTIFALAVTSTLLWNFRKERRMQTFLPFALATLPVLLVGAWWTMRYDRAVTGNPVELPYMLYNRTYQAVPTFWFLPLRADPRYDSPHMAALEGRNGWNAKEYHKARLAMRRLGSFTKILAPLGRFLGSMLLLTLFSPLAWSEERIRLLLPVAFISYLASCLPVAKFLHYFAALIVLILLLGACAADSRAMSYGRRRWVAPVLVAVSAIYSIWVTGSGLAHAPQYYPRQTRSIMLDECLKMPGKLLVFVKYDNRVSQDVEWVYNLADPNSQKVILVHDLSSADNAAMAQYYPDRSVWTAVVSLDGNLDLAYTLQRGLP